MHRPLREPIHSRIWRLIRGLLFYNTVYWRRASDGLTMPTLTPEERERQRPARNLEIIKPRTRPRAHIEAARGGEISNPQTLSSPDYPAESLLGGEIRSDETVGRATFRAETSVAADDGAEQVYVKRRRYRRRLVSGGSAMDRASFFERVFGRK